MGLTADSFLKGLPEEPDPKNRLVLILEPVHGRALQLETLLSDTDFVPIRVPTFDVARSLLSDRSFAAVVASTALPNLTSDEVRKRLSALSPTRPVIFITPETCGLNLPIDHLAQAELSTSLLVRSIHFAIDKKHREARMNYLARFDPITDLPNRKTFAESLQGHLDSKDPRAHIITVGLDRLRLLHASFGETGLHQVIRTIASRLSAALRDSDLLGRIDEERFAILLRGISDAEEVATLTDRLLTSVEHSIQLGGTRVAVTASAGIATSPENGESANDLLGKSQAALTQARQKCRGGVRFFDREAYHRTIRMHTMESELRDVLETELHSYFQPQISAAGDVSGFEALLRWKRPDGTMVPTSDFIPILEDSGMIREAGARVLYDTCKQIRKWNENGSSIRGAVNVSAIQFEDPDFPRIVESTLRDTGTNPDLLELELTESHLFSDEDQALKRIHRLKEIGVRLALDDFGTGYSSLAHLRRLPIDVLKLDRSFILGIHNAQDAAIANAIISLGHTVNKEVLAEGVEEIGQLEFLRAANCDCFQGFLFARAMPASECVGWIREFLSHRTNSPTVS